MVNRAHKLSKKDILQLAAHFIVCLIGMVLIFVLAFTALKAGIDGVALITSVSMIAGIVVALLGLKLKDIIWK